MGLFTSDRKTPRTGPTAWDQMRARGEGRKTPCMVCGHVTRRGNVCSPVCAKAAASAW